MATPLTDGINALTQYANETTGKQDTTLSDAVGSLVEGYGQGGTPKWEDFSGGNIQAIIGDGASYIETGISATNRNVYGCKFKPNQAVNYEYVFALSSTASTNSRCCVQRMGTSTTWQLTVAPVVTKNVTINTVTSVCIGIFGVGDIVFDLPVLLFKGYYRGTVESQISKATFYGLNIVDENYEYVAKLVPWKDENDVICVKNIVNGDIYYNAGTGTFGYIDLDGIEHI